MYFCRIVFFVRVFNITSFIFPGNVIKFSAFRHCFANFRHNVSLAMFRFLGPCAGSECRLSSVIRARSLLQFSSLILRMCPSSSSSQRSLRAVLGQRRPVHCLRHAGNTCEYTLQNNNDFISVSTYFSSFAHPTLHCHQVAETVCSQCGTLSRTPSSASITGSCVREARTLTIPAQEGDLTQWGTRQCLL